MGMGRRMGGMGGVKVSVWSISVEILFALMNSNGMLKSVTTAFTKSVCICFLFYCNGLFSFVFNLFLFFFLCFPLLFSPV